MDISVISLFPEMFEGFKKSGVIGRAIAKGLLNLDVINLRDYSNDRHGRVDDRPYGGGPGMVIKPDVAREALKGVLESSNCKAKVIYMSPQGKVATHQDMVRLARQNEIVFIAGRYEGIDERFIQNYVDEELSIGDYVLSGGELPAMVMVDAIARWLPGVLGHEESAEQDSFTNGLLDCPHYTRPVEFEGIKVPDILQSGNHKEIDKWRKLQQLIRTYQRRKDMMEHYDFSDEDRDLLNTYIQNVGEENGSSS